MKLRCTLCLLLSLLTGFISAQNSSTSSSTQEPEPTTTPGPQETELIVGSIKPKKDDCYGEKTLEAVNFLKEGGKKEDCKDYLTNLDKLRAFLASDEVNFNNYPGSLVFMNSQDHVLKLRCAPETKDRFKWTLKELPRGSNDALEASKKDEKEFKSDHDDEKYKLVFKAPPDADYYRRYMCQRKGSKKCTHYIHVITRPYPRLEMDPQYGDGAKDVKISCRLHECLYKYTSGKCKIHPRPQNDYEFMWRLPKTVSNSPEKYKCRDGLTGMLHKPFLHCTVENCTTNLKKVKKGEGKITFDHIIGEISDKNKKVKATVGSTLEIDKITTEHRGEVECIIIDKNGVPSSPTYKSLDKNIRFGGVRVIHVRKIIWTAIPAGILGFMILLIVIIQLACPLRMELDDGSIVHIKTEKVAPEAAPNATASAAESAVSSQPISASIERPSAVMEVT